MSLIRVAKILILIGRHLCAAPRPQKEAETLANAGRDVTVRGIWFDPELGAVINYDYTLLAARVPAPSLVYWDGRDNADIARFWS